MTDRKAERRKHPRSRSGFRMGEAEAADGIINHVVNISCSGVLCHTRRPVAEMTKMSIVLDLPEPVSQRVTAQGIVVRCEPENGKHDEFKVAIVYTRLDDRDHHAIREYVELDLSRPDSRDA